MDRQGRPLTAAFVRTVTRPGRYGDGRGGHGLYLRVRRRANGRTARTWCQRLALHGRRTNIGLGSYPVVTLAEARAKALENRRAVEQGRDPRGEGVPTVQAAAEKVIALHAEGWKAGSSLSRHWRQTFRDYVNPHIGRKRVDLVTTADVLAVLRPIWSAKPTVGRSVRQRLGAVMKWTIAAGYRADNPAGDAITAALPRNSNGHKHHAAVPYRRLADVLRQVRESDRYQLSARLALVFVALTATRTKEVRGARWSEIDLEACTWVIPPERVKIGKEHRVPLSVAAAGVLREAEVLRGLTVDGDIVFPSVGGKMLHNRAISECFRGLGVAGTIHGMRSAFRDWCADHAVDREVAEAALGHVVKSKAEAAYRRTDLLERRRVVMEAWGRYLAGDK